MTKQKNWLSLLRNAGVDNPAQELRYIIRSVEEALESSSRSSTQRVENPGSIECCMDPGSLACAKSRDDSLISKIIQRRCNREPLAKILGYKDFWKDRFITNEHTLDPRPDSETLIEVCLSLFAHRDVIPGQAESLNPGSIQRSMDPRFSSSMSSGMTSFPQRILELGVGTGCLILSLLKEFLQAKGVCVDISPEALKVAQNNAMHLELNDRVSFLESNWFSVIPGFSQKAEDPGSIKSSMDPGFSSSMSSGMTAFDLIISNPPYIAQHETINAEAAYDPHLALYAKDNGLAAYKTILKDASQFLTPHGYLVLEIGPSWGINQCDTDLIYIKTVKDLAGCDRVVVFQK